MIHGNLVAVLVGAIISMALGALWYSQMMFGNSDFRKGSPKTGEDRKTASLLLFSPKVSL